MYLDAVAADAVKVGEAEMSVGAKVSELVASNISDLPCRNGKSVMSPGRRPR